MPGIKRRNLCQLCQYGYRSWRLEEGLNQPGKYQRTFNQASQNPDVSSSWILGAVKNLCDMAQGFWRWARRNEGAYPQRSVTEAQRSPASKEQARLHRLFLYGPLDAPCGKCDGEMVGAVRFELTTSWSRTKRATKLRYAPTTIPHQAKAYYALTGNGGKQFRRSLKTKDRKLAERRFGELKEKAGVV